jgi:hypothetical protein
MKKSPHITIGIIVLLLFTASVLIRRPLFNKEFTVSHEWLSAHALITIQLWNTVPASVHHFNLLYTFLSPADRFVDNLWSAGVADRSGRYYYVSMPHLGFLTPYLAFKAFRLPATLSSLQLFGLGVHFLATILLLILLRRLTRGRKGSWLASIAGFCVLLFTPTALYYYQNAVVATVVVIPYTLVLLMSVSELFENRNLTPTRVRLLWLALFISVVGGCLTDWQGYFTAFAGAVVASAVALRDRSKLRRGAGVVSICCAGVVVAILVTVAQDAEIAGWQPFWHAIMGRLQVRSGGTGQGITSLFYYRQLFRFYSSDAPFLVLTTLLLTLTFRRGRTAVLGRAGIALAISLVAVCVDHVILSNHTSVHIFTTINTLPSIAILCALSVTAFLETSKRERRDAAAICVALALCITASSVEYWYAYRNRPHPFLATASAIAAVSRPSDVIFATGRDFQLPIDFIVPQMLYYLRRNVVAVENESEAYEYLATHSFPRGVLARFNSDFTVADMKALDSPVAGGKAVQPLRSDLPTPKRVRSADMYIK